ncbi:MAG: iron ABC transporter permease [Chloroflexota bacterium]|nr:iron ABC transporter permease [Chloroflexota bacterium]
MRLDTGTQGHGYKGQATRIHRFLVPLSPYLLVSLPLVFLFLFYFYPLASILNLSFAPDGHLSLAPLGKLFLTPYYLRTLWFTTWQAALSTLLTVGLALPGAYIFARYDFPGKSLIQALTTIPFVLPTIVVALAFTALLGPRGLLNLALMELFRLDRPPLDLQHTLAVILLAHVFYNYALVLRIVGTYWANLDPRLEEAARTLGASRWRAFREVTLPLLIPVIGAAALLVFVFCFTSFGVILILGGPRFATLEVEIYRQTINYLNLPLAAALSVVQIILTFALMTGYTRLQSRMTLPLELRSRQATQRQARNWREGLAIWANVGLMLVLLVSPLVALIGRSLMPSTTSTLGPASGRVPLGVSFTFYRQLFENPRGAAFYVPPVVAVRNSVGFALATAALSVTLGLMAAAVLDDWGETGFFRKTRFLRRLLDPVFMLPLGTSAVTLGLGYIVALDEPPLNLRTSPLLVVLAHTLVALPFVVRSVLPTLRSIHPQLRETAALLGASRWRVWLEVDLPIVARAVMVGAVFAFTISMGEFGATSLIARPERPTMPIAIYRFLGRPGIANYGQALAMSTLLMLVCALGFLAIERFRVGEVGEF